MEEKEWTLMSRGERESILTRIGIKKEAIDRNAKVNYAFLDEDVKQALAGVKRDVHEDEREYRKDRELIERYGVTSSFDKVEHHFEKALEAVDKSDFFTIFAERDAAMQELDDILNPPQPIPGYKKVREVATELGHSYMDALCEKLHAKCP